MIVRGLVAALAVFALVAASAAAQAPAKKPSAWEPLRFFVGSWTGTGNGQPGTSTVEREYAFALNDRFLEVRNKSTYLPQEKNPKGEVHEDRGMAEPHSEFVVYSESRFKRKK